MSFKFVFIMLVIGVVDFFTTVFLYEQLGIKNAFFIYGAILFLGWLLWLRLKKRFKLGLSLFEKEMKRLKKAVENLSDVPAVKFVVIVFLALVFLVIPGIVTSVLGISLLVTQLFSSEF